jgi:uncharacterized protein YxjI
MGFLSRHEGLGGTRYRMREKIFAIGDDYWIETADGERAFRSTVEGGKELSAKGNVVEHEYEIERDGEKVAEISKRWFRVRETYGIEVAPGEDPALILAVAVCIDSLAED